MIAGRRQKLRPYAIRICYFAQLLMSTRNSLNFSNQSCFSREVGGYSNRRRIAKRLCQFVSVVLLHPKPVSTVKQHYRHHDITDGKIV